MENGVFQLGSKTTVSSKERIISKSFIQPRTFAAYKKHFEQDEEIQICGFQLMSVVNSSKVVNSLTPFTWTRVFYSLQNGFLLYFLAPLKADQLTPDIPNFTCTSPDSELNYYKSLDPLSNHGCVLLSAINSVGTMKDTNWPTVIKLKAISCTYYLKSQTISEMQELLFNFHRAVTSHIISSLATNDFSGRKSSLNFTQSPRWYSKSTDIDTSIYDAITSDQIVQSINSTNSDPLRKGSGLSLTDNNSSPVANIYQSIDSAIFQPYSLNDMTLNDNDDRNDQKGPSVLKSPVSPPFSKSIHETVSLSSSFSVVHTSLLTSELENNDATEYQGVPKLYKTRSPAGLPNRFNSSPGTIKGTRRLFQPLAEDGVIDFEDSQESNCDTSPTPVDDDTESLKPKESKVKAKTGAYIPPAIRRQLEQERLQAMASSSNGVKSSDNDDEEVPHPKLFTDTRSLSALVEAISSPSNTARLANNEFSGEDNSADLQFSLMFDDDAAQSPPLPASLYGVTSVQGKRRTMEDFHVTSNNLWQTATNHKKLNLVNIYEDKTDTVTASQFNLQLPKQSDTSSVGFFAVYDGHSGSKAAKFAHEFLHVYCSHHPTMFLDNEEYPWPKGQMLAIEAAIERIDREFLSKARENSDHLLHDGSCCLIAIVKKVKTSESAETCTKPVSICVASLGDSRCVLSRKGEAVVLSTEHSPGMESEKKRIEEAGGWTTQETEMSIARLHLMDLQNPIIRRHAEKTVGFVTITRVNGDLSVSRAIGDAGFKLPSANKMDWYYEGRKNFEFTGDLVSNIPNWTEEMITDDDEFFILACDGLWEVMSSQEAIDVVKQSFKTSGCRDVNVASEELVNIALRLGSSDNITAVIVLL